MQLLITAMLFLQLVDKINACGNSFHMNGNFFPGGPIMVTLILQI